MQSRIKIIFLFVVLYIYMLHSFTAKAQGRLVMNNNAFIVIDNSAKVVLANSSPTALTLAGTGGNIVTENEFDQLKWNISNTTGNFTIPFTTNSGVKIPLLYSVTSGGSGTGNVLFSTYGSADWQNSNYLPTDVTHVNNINSGLNNSANTIDRFWIVDANNYTTRPNVNMTFTYVDAEHLNAGNTITESNLAAQRFNSTSFIWGDYLPTGTINTISNTVSGVIVNGSNFYRSWTLVESDNPMPVELLIFDYDCVNEISNLKWTTASETENMYFTVESSDNGMIFETIQTVAGAGNSNQPLDYSISVQPNKFYRLTQTDFNGMNEELGTVFVNCKAENELAFWQAIEKLNELKVSGLEEGELEYQLYDMSGKLIVNQQTTASSGVMQISLPELSNGMYTVSIRNNERSIAGKIMMIR